jgi:hypothetical protein
MINGVFYKPQKEISGGVKSGERGTRECENTVLCHVPMGTVFQLDGAPYHFSCHVHAFLDRNFLIIGYEEGDKFLGLLVLQIWLVYIFSSRSL